MSRDDSDKQPGWRRDELPRERDQYYDGPSRDRDSGGGWRLGGDDLRDDRGRDDRSRDLPPG